MSISVIKDEADKFQFDGLKVLNKQPGRYYRFARRADMSVARSKFYGYEFIDTTKDPERSILGDNTKMKKGTEVDNTVTIGDAVLMYIDKDKHDDLIASRQTTVNARTASVKGSARSAIDRAAGSKVSSEDNREIHRGKGVVEYEDLPQEDRDEIEHNTKRTQESLSELE